MDRRRFLSRFSIGVLACSMLRDALIPKAQIIPVRTSAHYEMLRHPWGFRVSKRMLEDDIYADGTSVWLAQYTSQGPTECP